MSNTIQATKEQIIELLRGIALGRTLHDLEKAAGVPVESFIYLIQTDQEVATAFKSARELSAYVLEDEVTTRLRANADAPEGAAKTNAIKAWADHIDSMIKVRNPTVYSGKADVGGAINVRFVTTLDLNAPKTIENVYDLTGTIVETVAVQDLTETQYNQLVAECTAEAGGSPFEAALAIAGEGDRLEEAAAILEAAIEGPGQGGRDNGVVESEPTPASRVKKTSDAPVAPKKPREPRRGARSNSAKAEKVR